MQFVLIMSTAKLSIFFRSFRMYVCCQIVKHEVTGKIMFQTIQNEKSSEQIHC